jgi:hypothetical protein
VGKQREKMTKQSYENPYTFLEVIFTWPYSAVNASKMAVILFFKETNYDHCSKLTLTPLFGKLT